MATLLLLLSIFGGLANAYQVGADPYLSLVAVALISGFHITSLILCFSSISGNRGYKYKLFLYPQIIIL